MVPTSMKGRPKTLMADGSPRWRSLQIHVVSGSDLMMGISEIPSFYSVNRIRHKSYRDRTSGTLKVCRRARLN